MGVISDAPCNFREEGLQTAAHFICRLRHYVNTYRENLIYDVLKLIQHRTL